MICWLFPPLRSVYGVSLTADTANNKNEPSMPINIQSISGHFPGSFAGGVTINNLIISTTASLTLSGHVRFSNVTFSAPKGITLAPAQMQTVVSFDTPVETTNGQPLPLQCIGGPSCIVKEPFVNPTACSSFSTQLQPGGPDGLVFEAGCSD